MDAAWDIAVGDGSWNFAVETGQTLDLAAREAVEGDMLAVLIPH